MRQRGIVTWEKEEKKESQGRGSWLSGSKVGLHL
jgi:hypothetical protein